MESGTFFNFHEIQATTFLLEVIQVAFFSQTPRSEASMGCTRLVFGYFSIPWLTITFNQCLRQVPVKLTFIHASSRVGFIWKSQSLFQHRECNLNQQQLTMWRFRAKSKLITCWHWRQKVERSRRNRNRKDRQPNQCDLLSTMFLLHHWASNADIFAIKSRKVWNHGNLSFSR